MFLQKKTRDWVKVEPDKEANFCINPCFLAVRKEPFTAKTQREMQESQGIPCYFSKYNQPRCAEK
jgi:hypothetical protein